MFLYNLALYLLRLGIRLASWKGGKPALLHRGLQKTWAVLQTIQASDKIVWIHVASLGEFEQARVLIEKIKTGGQYKILLTFFSPSGYEIQKNYPHADFICYLPIDTKANAKRFLKLAHPEMAIFVKYEFWLNYLFQLQKAQIDTYLIAALFREKQIFFKPHGGLFRKALRAFKHIFVQNGVSQSLLTNLGLKNVSVAGDTRVDRVHQLAENQAQNLPKIEAFAASSSQTLVFGSTWEPDEELICKYLNQCKDSSLAFIIAPHKVDKAHIDALCAQLQVPYSRYSETKQEISTRVLVLDTIGILSSVYQYAQIAYIGGGFKTGLHNTLEPATFGLPILFGPKYHKFEEARQLVATQGAFSVGNYAQFEDKLNYLLQNGKQHGAHSSAFIEANVGATNRVYEAVFGKSNS